MIKQSRMNETKRVGRLCVEDDAEQLAQRADEADASLKVGLLLFMPPTAPP